MQESHPKEFLGDVGAALGVLGVPVRADFFGVFRGQTIAALHAAKLDCKIMVGGAVLTPEYAEKIGADWYAKDAQRSADIAKEFFGV